MKSMKSEDLSKDLQVNLRISPQTVKDFMMNWMNRTEFRGEIDLTQTCAQICVQNYGPTERSSFQLNTLQI